MGLYDTSKRLLGAWADNKIRVLQGSPDTKVDSGGSQGKYSFDGQKNDREKLREIKEIRESGGVISRLVHAKALMMFGTGVEFESDNPELAEWLESEFNDIDNLLIDLGEDALWYPFSLAELVETRGNSFSHVEPVEPWTMEPKTNEYGEIIAWEQELQGTNETEIFQPDELASFVLNKSCARDKTGISEVMRAEDEIRSYKENKQAINQAVDTAAYRRHWWQVGREGAGVIDDNELRRVRNRIDNLQGDTQLVTGRDLEHELMDAMDPSAFKTISEMDIRNMCVALGVPIELASVISEGLGSGEQSGVRMQAFLLEARASQRALADQFIQEVIRPVLRDYSPFSADENVELVFGEPLSEEAAFADRTPYMTLNEIRAENNLPPEEDSELGESYRKPANIEAPEEEEPEEGEGGFGGIFGRELSDAPEWDEPYLRIFEERLWTDENDSKALVAFNESEVPEMVLQRLRDVILSGSVFSDIQSVPSSELMELREVLADNLGQDGWSLSDLTNELATRFDLDESRAETIARTETQAAVNTAREQAYDERTDRDEDLRFSWVGPSDHRTTEACEWIKSEIPEEGVTLDELKELIQEAPEHDPEITTEPREYTPHISCRHTYVRSV